MTLVILDEYIYWGHTVHMKGFRVYVPGKPSRYGVQRLVGC
ncbi:hypothetical protein [Bacillus phage CP-51]|uniref:Uncharacterized protein n=1 Tax=Bacillus phage CP-51 TaxID=1391188 RepID=A0A068EU09_9CAUD|nr:hypothetical protein OZ73_gp001 [Bacillus phage CP-51]AID50436.1 hypothetical protein [Bacillus phage CP-51]